MESLKLFVLVYLILYVFIFYFIKVIPSTWWESPFFHWMDRFSRWFTAPGRMINFGRSWVASAMMPKSFALPTLRGGSTNVHVHVRWGMWKIWTNDSGFTAMVELSHRMFFYMFKKTVMWLLVYKPHGHYSYCPALKLSDLVNKISAHLLGEAQATPGERKVSMKQNWDFTDW